MWLATNFLVFWPTFVSNLIFSKQIPNISLNEFRSSLYQNISLKSILLNILLITESVVLYLPFIEMNFFEDILI